MAIDRVNIGERRLVASENLRKGEKLLFVPPYLGISADSVSSKALNLSRLAIKSWALDSFHGFRWGPMVRLVKWWNVMMFRIGLYNVTYLFCFIFEMVFPWSTSPPSFPNQNNNNNFSLFLWVKKSPNLISWNRFHTTQYKELRKAKIVDWSYLGRFLDDDSLIDLSFTTTVLPLYLLIKYFVFSFVNQRASNLIDMMGISHIFGDMHVIVH